MGRAWAIAVIVTVTFVAASPAGARPMQPMPHAVRAVEACREGSEAAVAAQVALRAMGRRIDALEDAAPIGDVTEALAALLRSECFALSVETGGIAPADSAVSLKHWWSAQGGGHWLWSYVGRPAGVPETVVAPPTPRRTLALPAAAADPLARFLCPLGEAACGAETRGWLRRAEIAFRASRRSTSLGAAVDPVDAARRCEVEAARSAPRLRYTAWRVCIETYRTEVQALPLGSFKAAHEGWLITLNEPHLAMAGPCRIVAAFDLARGTALTSSICGPAGYARPFERVRAGRVSLDNLREAFLMLLLWQPTSFGRPYAETYPLPSAFPRRWIVDGVQGRGYGGLSGSDDRPVRWIWLPATGRPLAGRVLTWSATHAERHAHDLLQIAEASLVEGCVAAADLPPLAIARDDAQIINDLKAAELADVPDAFIEARAVWAAATCRTEVTRP